MVARSTRRSSSGRAGFRVVGVARNGEAALAEIVRRCVRTWCCSTCTCPTSAGSTCCAGSAAAGDRRRRGDGDRGPRGGDGARSGGRAARRTTWSSRSSTTTCGPGWRRSGPSHRALAGVATPAQDDIDAVFAPVGRGREVLPKGLSARTAAAVLDALAGGAEISAGRVRRGGRHLAGLRPALPRALRHAGQVRGAPRTTAAPAAPSAVTAHSAEPAAPVSRR